MHVDKVITYIDKKDLIYMMLEIRFKRILIRKMNAFGCIVLVSISIVTVKAIKRIPVNISYQGTGRKFYPGDFSGTEDVENKSTINLIDADSNQNLVESNKSINRDITLTEFILEAAKVLKTFGNYDLEETFFILDREVWENLYKGCKSHELTDIRRYMSNQLRKLKDEPADTLRQYLDTIIDTISNEDYGEVWEMINYVNSLYVGEHEKFIEVLLGLMHRRISADVDLEHVIKHALKSLIFDRYCNMNGIDRHKLVKMVKHYWKQITSQINDYKVNRSINVLPLVTPFIYERRTEQMHKKRRFNTVNEGRANKYSPQQLEEKLRDLMRADSKEIKNTTQKHNTKVSDANAKEKFRAISKEIINTTQKHDSKDFDENVQKNKNRAYSEELSWENSKDASNNNDFVNTKKTDVDVGGREILETVTKDAIKKSIHRTRQRPEPETSMIDALRLNKPLMYRKSNKTIEKLIKIGTLAKEINDMIASEGDSLRSNPSRQSLSSMLGMSVLQIMGDYGDMATTTDTVYTDEGDGEKDILISMKAKVG